MPDAAAGWGQGWTGGIVASSPCTAAGYFHFRDRSGPRHRLLGSRLWQNSYFSLLTHPPWCVRSFQCENGTLGCTSPCCLNPLTASQRLILKLWLHGASNFWSGLYDFDLTFNQGMHLILYDRSPLQTCTSLGREIGTLGDDGP
jgi:hypothetical protein